MKAAKAVALFEVARIAGAVGGVASRFVVVAQRHLHSALQAELDRQKLAESKVDPKILEWKAEMKRNQDNVAALAKKLEHISLPDYGDIKKEETRVQVVNLMKDCWSINDMVEKGNPKTENTCRNKASAISSDPLVFNGIAKGYLVKTHITVRQ